ncbi:UDP-glucose dehydrogenase [Moraxella bovoculi 237]|uniref:UDP-glucose 6-dehydrogenase n=1 Tax=Moraxella bovoculi 237 TaxID=743974 RepID=A0A066UF22_9GAMM|nr:UDP-glucose 6-dehydrogenase [Moraxella bovoculi]KDN24492.1 UDP-glucose dehydrogenase [Moraxella bovoculi 237]
MKTHDTVYIIGANHEAINAGILFASLNKKVHLLSVKNAIDETLFHYHFDRQINALWSLYVNENKIIHHHKNSRDDTLDFIKQSQGSLIWLFVDDMSDEELALFTETQDNPHSQIILSGIDTIGKMEQIADEMISKWVYYLPFVFMKDGANFSSFYQSDLVLIGEKTANSVVNCEIISFIKSQAKKFQIDTIKTIEFARSAIMAMLATRLSFMNEMTRLADKENVNIKHIERIMGSDSRIGSAYLGAGWGFGGKTLPNELALLKSQFDNQNVKSDVLNAVIDVNDDQKELIFRKFWRYFNGFIENKTVMIWGAGYRTGAGLSTNSAIHPLLKLLWSYDIKTMVYTNNTTIELQTMYENERLFSITNDPYELNEIDGLFIINWSGLTPPDVYELNKHNIPIFDAKNILSDDEIKILTSDYIGIGRKNH